METNLEQYSNQITPINHSLGSYISHILAYAPLVGGIAVLLLLVYGGLEWLLSGGSKDKLQTAKDRITNALIGLAVLAAAWAIFLLVNHFFGLGINTTN